MTTKDLNDIKKALDAKKVVVGTSVTIKNIKLGNVSKVYISHNCKSDVKDDILKYSKVSKVEVINLKQSNEELGVVCKKPFSISVLSILNDNKK